MSLRRLLGSPVAAISGRYISTAGLSGRPLSTAAASSHPAWAIMNYMTMVDGSSSSPGACFRPVDPPAVSHITAPAHLIDPTERPNAGRSGKLRHLAGNVVQLVYGNVGAASGDGLLLLSYHDLRAEGPANVSALVDSTETHRFVCNPLTGHMLRLPDIAGSRRALAYHRMGLLTQAYAGELGHAPPDRFAVAELLYNGGALAQFLSEEGEWRTSLTFRTAPLPRRMEMNQETVSFAGRLWWVDLTYGAVSADPFADRPEIRFVQLPRGSVMPPRAHTDDGGYPRDSKSDERALEQGLFMREVAKHRRIGVSEGRLRYAEVSPHDPCLLSSYALNDDEGSGWTLEHQVALRQVLEDGSHPWQENSAPPEIVVLDPLNAGVMYLKVGKQVIVVDIHNGKVIGAASAIEDHYHSLVPCVLPPWLGSSRIPATMDRQEG